MKNPTESNGSSVEQTSATDENLLCSEPVRCNHGDIHDEPSYDNSCNNQCQLSTDNQLNKVPCLNYSSNELSSDTSEDLLVLCKATALQTNIQGNSSKLLCGTHSKKEGPSNLNKFNPGATTSVMTENACAKNETKEPESGSTVVVAAVPVSGNIKAISTQRTHQMISSQFDEESHTQSHCKRIKISHHESSTKGRMNAGNGEHSENFSESKLHRQCHKTSSPVAVADHMSSSTLLKSQQSVSEKNPSVTQENIAIPRNIVPFKVKIEPQESDEFLSKPSTNPISQSKASVKREASIIPGNESGLPVVSHVRSLKLEKSDGDCGNIIQETDNHHDVLGNRIMKVSEVSIAQAVFPGNNDGTCTCDVYCQTSLTSSESSELSSDDELSTSLYSSTSEDLLVRPHANSPKLSRTLSWKDLHKLDPAGAVASVMAGEARAKSEKEPTSRSVEVQAPILGKNIKNNPGRRTCQVVSSQSDKKKPTGSNRKIITNFESFIVLGDPGRRLPLKGYESDESAYDCAIKNVKFRTRNVFQDSDELLSDTSNIRDSGKQLLSISDKTFTPNEKQDNEPGSITRKKVGFSWRNSENRDFKHKRNDHVSESSQLYSTTSDEDCFQKLNKCCCVESTRRNRRRSSHVSLAMRNLKRISRIKRLGKIQLLDCVVVLEKVKVK